MKIFKNLPYLVFIVLIGVTVVYADVLIPTNASLENIRPQILLPKTGQINCWSAAGILIRCAGTGQDGEYQIGLPINGDRFIDNKNGTLFDRATNLIWQKCSKGQGVLNCSGTATTTNWAGALNYCNTLNLVGSGWRLPNRNELISIVNLSGAYPAIDNKMFPNTPSVYFWSSTSHQEIFTSAWLVDFGSGLVNFYVKSFQNYVRCVR